MDKQQTKSLAFIASLVAALSSPASAELYRCSEGAKMIISDHPCDRESPPICDAEAVPAAQSVQAPARANVITGYVVSIADGDTITVLNAGR